MLLNLLFGDVFKHGALGAEPIANKGKINYLRFNPKWGVKIGVQANCVKIVSAGQIWILVK